MKGGEDVVDGEAAPAKSLQLGLVKDSADFKTGKTLMTTVVID